MAELNERMVGAPCGRLEENNGRLWPALARPYVRPRSLGAVARAKRRAVATAREPDDVDVLLRGVPFSEEIVYYVRKCCRLSAQTLGDGGQWTVRLERSEDCPGRVSAVVLVRVDDAWMTVVQSDPDEFLAVRNAFAMLDGRLLEATGMVLG